MGSVCVNASLTIAVANAKDDKYGFLRKRSDALTSLVIMHAIGKPVQVYLQTQDDGIKVHGFIEDEPLGARGWTPQEQHLSRRSLRFGSTKMSWDCRCLSLHEPGNDHSYGMRPSMGSRPYTTAFRQLSYDSWYETVVAFTERLLKHDTDKLPALSDLATEVAKIRNGTYYAGLWWEDMASGML